MREVFYPVHWAGGQAVVALPEHIGASNAGRVRDGLLSVINLGAKTLIADMTVTVSCDHAGADAIVRAWQRAILGGTELRLVITSRRVSEVLDLRGIDRRVSVYPSLEAASAARLPTAANDAPARMPEYDATAPCEHRQLLDEVVNVLFQAGLSLQGTTRLSADAAGETVDGVIAELDRLVQQVRGSALGLPD